MKYGKTKAFAIIAAVFVFITLSFNNCSPVQFKQADKASKPVEGLGDPDTDPTPPPGTTPVPTPPPADVAIKNCIDATKKGALLSVSQNIVFDDTKVETNRNNVCEFGVGENLSVKNDYVRARFQQDRKLDLPDGAVLCGIEMVSDLQSMKYDDTFFLNFNGYVIASNLNTAVFKAAPEPALIDSKMVGLYKYDWLASRDTKFMNDGQADYCLGVQEGFSTCQWPITEQQGKIKFDLAPELLITIGVKKSSAEQSFSFVTTGDNDPANDCYHERLELKMKTYYYLPK